MSTSEKKILVNKETKKTIWRITNSKKEDIHTYYDRCPWSSDGKYILFSSAESRDLGLQGNILATQKGEIYLMDTKNYERVRIAENAFFHSHQGAETVWNFKKNKIYFRLGGDKVGVVYVATREVEQFQEGRFYRFFGLSSDGKKFVFENIDSTQLKGKGIYTMNEDCS
jgi:Tol biopolymer transport system component